MLKNSWSLNHGTGRLHWALSPAFVKYLVCDGDSLRWIIYNNNIRWQVDAGRKMGEHRNSDTVSLALRSVLPETCLQIEELGFTSGDAEGTALSAGSAGTAPLFSRMAQHQAYFTSCRQHTLTYIRRHTCAHIRVLSILLSPSSPWDFSM